MTRSMSTWSCYACLFVYKYVLSIVLVHLHFRQQPKKYQDQCRQPLYKIVEWQWLSSWEVGNFFPTHVIGANQVQHTFSLISQLLPITHHRTNHPWDFNEIRAQILILQVFARWLVQKDASKAAGATAAPETLLGPMPKHTIANINKNMPVFNTVTI